MKKSSPLGVISSSGLCGHYFIKRFAVFFESSYLIANVSQHVAIRDHFGFAADTAVSRITMVLSVTVATFASAALIIPSMFPLVE